MTQFLISTVQTHSSDFYLFTDRNSFTSQIWTFWLPFRNHFSLTGMGSTFTLRSDEEVIIHTEMKAPSTEGFRLPSISLIPLEQQQVHQSERDVVPLGLCQVRASLCQASSHLHQLQVKRSCSVILTKHWQPWCFAWIDEFATSRHMPAPCSLLDMNLEREVTSVQGRCVCVSPLRIVRKVVSGAQRLESVYAKVGKNTLRWLQWARTSTFFSYMNSVLSVSSYKNPDERRKDLVRIQTHLSIQLLNTIQQQA